MARAIGLVELTTVSTGFKAADDMSKAADVEILQAEVTCPGKFVVLIAGDLSAVRASVDSVKGRYGDKVIDHFVLLILFQQAVAIVTMDSHPIHRGKL